MFQVKIDDKANLILIWSQSSLSAKREDAVLPKIPVLKP